MKRTALAVLVTTSVALAGCGSAGPAGTPTPSAASTTPGTATSAPPSGTLQPTPPPPGGSTVSVTLTGGDHPGSYSGSANPNCSFGFLGEGVWGVNYADEAAGEAGLTGVIFVAQPDPAGGTEPAFNLAVTIGTSELYTVASSTADTTLTITDGGATAVIHVAGSTITETATVDATITCPSVTRG